MLRLITAWSSQTLADWLEQWYAADPGDPFARDLVVVPTPGMERFVTRSLARRLGASSPAGDGVCAAVDFIQPAELMARMLPLDSRDDDPWAPSALPWHCLRAVDELVAEREEQFDQLRHYLRLGTRSTRRVAVARRVAGLLNDYAIQRPDLLVDWAVGDLESTAPTHRWQAEVFRHVLGATGTQPWPMRLTERLRTGLGPVDLPPRLAVVGVTRHGDLERRLLEALAREREVAVLMVEHTPEASGGSDRHGLAAALGREEALTLRSLRALPVQEERLADYPRPGEGLLSRLQASIAGTGAHQPEAALPQDNSLTVHGCAGALRQVEVLRDQVLELLERDPSLQPRDVLVMCTDIDLFAPLIAQVLGTSAAPSPGPTRDLRVSVADRVARTDNPVLQVQHNFLALLAGRMTAGDVLDFMTLPAVAQRFGLDRSAHARLERLTAEANIRWGLNTAHRASFGIDVGAANTWEAGLDRLAMGLAVDGRDIGVVHGVAPMEACGDADVGLVAALATLVNALEEAWEFSRHAHPAIEWAGVIPGWIEPLVGGEAQWRVPAASAVVADSLAGANPLELDEVVAVLDAELARFAPRPRLLSGGIDVVAMRPMRNIPFRVICLVGLDDGAFPRGGVVGADDVLGLDPRPGERDPRAEDRQVFLDAVCAAQDHLVVTYTSRNPVTGADMPPAAPLVELLDAVGDIVHQHPLVAHDPRNFRPPSESGVAVSFDRTAAELASTAPSPPTPVRLARIQPVPADVPFDDLLDFWRSPAKVFLRHLGLPLDNAGDPPDHDLPIDLDGLQKWKLGDPLVRSDLDVAQARRLAETRGSLPVVRSESEWDEIERSVVRLRDEVARHQGGEQQFLQLDLPLDPSRGTRLVGVLQHPATGPLVDAGYGRLKPVDVLALRMRIAALCAAGVPVAGLLIRRRGGNPQVHREKVWQQSTAAQWLRGLAYLRHIGLSRPLPFVAATSSAYAAQIHDRSLATREALKCWDGWDTKERDLPECRTVWESRWENLTADPPLTGGWFVSEDTLFGQVAEFVFGRKP